MKCTLRCGGFPLIQWIYVASMATLCWACVRMDLCECVFVCTLVTFWICPCLFMHIFVYFYMLYYVGKRLVLYGRLCMQDVCVCVCL